MKPVHHEVKTQNGIPTLSDSEIEKLVALNPMREKPLSKGQVVASLESLKTVYAKHTGRNQPVKSNDHAPCLGLDGKCGSTDFVRTGTCFVCLNCSTSQGCS